MGGGSTVMQNEILAADRHVVVRNDGNQIIVEFQTDDDLADEMVERADWKGGYLLEPSAGVGNIIDAMLRAGVAGDQIIACENQTFTYLYDRVPIDQVFGFDFISGEHRNNAGWYLIWRYLRSVRSSGVDAAIMNPPFGPDVYQHIYLASDLIERGGNLVTTVPQGEVSVAAEEFYRDFLPNHFSDYTVEALPDDTYSGFGVSVKANLIVAKRKTYRFVGE